MTKVVLKEVNFIFSWYSSSNRLTTSISFFFVVVTQAVYHYHKGLQLYPKNEEGHMELAMLLMDQVCYTISNQPGNGIIIIIHCILYIFVIF